MEQGRDGKRFSGMRSGDGDARTRGMPAKDIWYTLWMSSIRAFGAPFGNVNLRVGVVWMESKHILFGKLRVACRWMSDNGRSAIEECHSVGSHRIRRGTPFPGAAPASVREQQSQHSPSALHHLITDVLVRIGGRGLRARCRGWSIAAGMRAWRPVVTGESLRMRG